MRIRGTWLIAPVASGLIAAAAVYVGDALEWAGFSGRTGFLGTHWLDSPLYALGDYTAAMAIVSGIWFTYAFAACALVEFLVLRQFRPELMSPNQPLQRTGATQGFPVVPMGPGGGRGR